MDKIFNHAIIFVVTSIFILNTLFTLMLIFNFYAPTNEGFELNLERYEIVSIDNKTNISISLNLNNLYNQEIPGIVICENYRDGNMFFYNIDSFSMSELGNLKLEINYTTFYIPSQIIIDLQIGHGDNLNLKIII